ncbi:hypothetical protein LINPERPRIM_LOCUS10236 [Linum perenne]
MKPEAAAFLNSLSSAASPSSSSRREHHDSNLATAADSSSKTVGCMSGILRLVSKYHHRSRRRRRFLTFRRPSASIANEREQIKPDAAAAAFDAHRSPTLPPEIRRSTSDSPNCSDDNRNRNRQALVARLMGLNDDEDGGGGDMSVAAEQRRKLLGALEKCDEDLKVLKEMIEVVTKSSFCSTKSGKAELEHPSRLSELTRPSHHHYKSHAYSPGFIGGIPRQQKKKPGLDQEDAIFLFNTHNRKPQSATAASLHRRNNSTPPPPPPPPETISSGGHRRTSSSVDRTAMAESVEKACNDIAWGERREIGRIGLALHDQICRDLVEELVREIIGLYCFEKKKIKVSTSSSSSSSSSAAVCQTLPFESCKRSLRF